MRHSHRFEAEISGDVDGSRIIDLTARADKSNRKGHRDTKSVHALVLHQTASRANRKHPLSSYLKIRSHFAILRDGGILQLHPISALMWEPTGFNNRSVAVEFTGHVPSTGGKRWTGEESGQNQVTPAQVEAGRYLIRWLVNSLDVTHLLAHRESSGARENDSRPNLWHHLGQWAIDNLNLRHGDARFRIGSGDAIRAEWRGRTRPLSIAAPTNKEAHTGLTDHLARDWREEGHGEADELDANEFEPLTQVYEQAPAIDSPGEEEWEQERFASPATQPRSRFSRPPPVRGTPPRPPHPRFPRRPGLSQPLGGCNCPDACPAHGTEYARWVQTALNRALGLRLPVTGRIDAATRSAIRSFQEQRGLPVDGIAGPEVERALIGARASAASASSPTPATDTPTVDDTPPASELFGFEDFEWEEEVDRSSRGYILWVQKSLNRLANARLVEDGISGSMTRAAVQAFQRSKGLTVDGIVGPNTEAALIRAGATAPPGGSPATAVPVDTPLPASGPGFTFDGVPAAVMTLLRARREREAVALAIRHGDRNENHLSDLIFFNRHPEREGRFIVREEPNYTAVSKEWITIRDTIVRPALGAPAPRPRPGTGGGRIASPADVHYLALEGGGGKGVTYLGAVKALERLGVLPIDINRPGQNQVKGISGASAGAISALMLAVGMTSTQVGDILSNEDTFTAFYDGPDVGRFRWVNSSNQPAVKDAGLLPANACGAPAGLTAARYILKDLVLERLLGAASSTILSQPERYFCNVLFNGGLFPGFAARKFLADIVTRYLGRKLAAYPGQTGATVGFALFHQLTGVDLVITGTNITKRRPGIFSCRHTPLFPVAEAVGISMSFPLAFKPVLVEVNVPVGPNARADDYHGLWVDGGMLNNLPLHAFDHLGPGGSTGGLRSLHPNMLGLRLTDGPCAAQSRSTQGRSTFILPYLPDLLFTLLYPSEEGQIRTPGEAAQTIDLRTYCLETLEFGPSEDKKREPILQAERSVNRYFGKG